MESIILDILAALRQSDRLDAKELEGIVRKHNKNIAENSEHHSKKKLLPYYLAAKQSDPDRWKSWDVDDSLEKRLVQTLQMKPGRTASGVATITVLTKPWKCSSNCLYCPNDLRMPKSYLADEPACQRAERTYFDPYLQVAARLYALGQMGHVTDKIELIVLGGTWSDYPEAYQIWFVKELFRALNEADDATGIPFYPENILDNRRARYQKQGLSNSRDDLSAFVQADQQRVFEGSLTYNQAMEHLYEHNDAWLAVSQTQVANFGELEAQQTHNETASHRVVGLVIETRPDTVTSTSLKLIRRLGCTKVQIGVQSLNPRILKLNHRDIGVERIRQAFELLRIFGFKIHVHFMANLYGATPDDDKLDYERLVTETPYLPDEVKLYPCALVNGTGLCACYESGTWRPYREDELLDVLVANVINTPPYTRISRMIRDISAHDILVGNKKVNLRQLVEHQAELSGASITEIRHREIGTGGADVGRLTLQDYPYETTVSSEHFLQWTTPDNGIAGFLRLSLPQESYVVEHTAELPIALGEAMIREVHVYGKVAGLHKSGKGAQHLGLGKQLVEAACALAKSAGYSHINVISSVGTREYYRGLGFCDNELYQQREL